MKKIISVLFLLSISGKVLATQSLERVISCTDESQTRWEMNGETKKASIGLSGQSAKDFDILEYKETFIDSEMPTETTYVKLDDGRLLTFVFRGSLIQGTVQVTSNQGVTSPAVACSQSAK